MTCDDRCAMAGRELLERCLEAGHDPAECEARASEAVDHCIEENCLPPDCAAGCAQVAHEVFRDCIAMTLHPDSNSCAQEARRAFEACVGEHCDAPTCEDRCGAAGDMVQRECLANGGSDADCAGGRRTEGDVAGDGRRVAHHLATEDARARHHGRPECFHVGVPQDIGDRGQRAERDTAARRLDAAQPGQPVDADEASRRACPRADVDQQVGAAGERRGVAAERAERLVEARRDGQLECRQHGVSPSFAQTSQPPSTAISLPVMFWLSSLAMNKTALAMSSGVVTRLSAISSTYSA